MNPVKIVLCKDEGRSCCPTLEDMGDGTHVLKDDDGGMVMLTDDQLDVLASTLASRVAKEDR